MADNVRVLKIDTEPAQVSVKDLRNELKELKNTLLSTTEGTEEYNQALTQAAEITHTLQEQTELIKASAMDFGQIASNCTNAVGGMVAGFQAAKATLNLFGIENQAVIKSLQQMQNLMAITQALPSIDKGVKAFKALSLAIKAGTGSLHGFKAALVSTGIGAAVVAVGALAANFDKLKGWITGTNEELEKQKQLEMEKHIEGINTELEKQMSLEEQIARIQGKGDLEIAQAKYDVVKKQVDEQYKELYNANIIIRTNKELLKEAQAEGASKKTIAYYSEQIAKWEEKARIAKETAEGIEEKQLKGLKEQLEIQKTLQGYRDERARQEKAEKAAEDARRKADARRKEAENERKKRIEEEKRAVEKLKDEYSKLSEEIKLFDASDYEKDLAALAKAEQESLKMIADARKKGIISKTQYEKDKASIEKQYAKLRENAANEEAAREREKSIELLETTYQLEQAKLQKQYDEKLISEKDFNDRKKELMVTYVQDYVDNLQFMLDTEKDLTDEQILDITTKINEAREMLKPAEDDAKTEGESMAKGISEAINASALALNDFSDNPAWGNILKNVATLAANWDLLHAQIQKGGKEAFTAYAQIAATALSAVAQMMNGLAAEQDTSNKEGFESAKKYQIAGATMSMLAGIASAWASSMQLMFPANVIVGSLLSAMMLATGIMQITKIKNTKFDSKGSGAGGGSPNAGAVSSVIAPVQYTQDVQGASIEGSIKDTKVYVTETDISDTQEKVHVSESEATY